MERDRTRRSADEDRGRDREREAPTSSCFSVHRSRAENEAECGNRGGGTFDAGVAGIRRLEPEPWQEKREEQSGAEEGRRLRRLSLAAA